MSSLCIVKSFVGTEQMQLSFLPLVDENELKSAWIWLRDEMQPHSQQTCQSCIYDHKKWKVQGAPKSLKADGSIEKHLGILFLASEFGDAEQIYKLVNFNRTMTINRLPGLLDKDILNVIKEKKGFRDSLSEHLAFWVRLASEAKVCPSGQRFVGKLPHIQSRDKGSDGLFIAVGQKDYIEIQSVKNSIRDPRAQVGTKSFRTNGKVLNRKKPKQLEEFWLTANENWGIQRLQRELTSLCLVLGTTNKDFFKMALGNKNLCFYNAIVVADEKYAREAVFEGYEHVTSDVKRRLATYISSEQWQFLAEETRRWLLKHLGI